MMYRTPPHIDVGLVLHLLERQFPRWSALPIRAVEPGGWDNRTFRLGEDMAVRLPSDSAYAPQVDKEHQWLPRLAPHLPLSIPVPLAKGLPDPLYPFHWSIYRWLPGAAASRASVSNLSELARDLAGFLIALQRIDTAGGPPPGTHCFHRGAAISVYDSEARRALEILRSDIDAKLACSIWETAVATSWSRAPVWFHGDLSPDNLLLLDGRLEAVIDFGCCGVGDPACDLSIAWTLFSGESRAAFRATLELDDETWLRGQAWTLWKAMITLVEHAQSDSQKASEARRVLGEIFTNPLAG